jgi:hypothetical protein
MEHRWNEIDRGKPKNSEGKTCHSATLSTINPTWTDPGSNAVGGRRLTAWAMARPRSHVLRAAHSDCSIVCIVWPGYVCEERVLCSLTINLKCVSVIRHRAPTVSMSNAVSFQMVLLVKCLEHEADCSALYRSYRIDGVLPPLHDVALIKHKNKFTSTMQVRNKVVSCGEEAVEQHALLIWELCRGNWPASRPGRFIPG